MRSADASGRIRIAEPAERRVDERVGRDQPLLRALAVERPAVDAVRAPVALGFELGEPVTDQRRLADAAPGHDRDHVLVRVGPCLVETAELGAAADEKAARHRQAVDRHPQVSLPLRPRFPRRQLTAQEGEHKLGRGPG